MTAGIIRIAHTRKNPMVIAVVLPKLEMIFNFERIRAANPNTVVRPDTVRAVPIVCTLVCIAE